MQALEKLKLLENKYDVCGGTKICSLGHIYDASTPRSKCPLYKTLMSNACSYDCKYCVNNKKTRQTTAAFEPEELAKHFMHLYHGKDVEGLFLSSGVVKDADKTTELMLDTVRNIRFKYNYRGYIHFKILPGTSYELIKQASELADRLSINLESPSKSRLAEVATVKDFKNDILRRQAWIKNLHPNQTTQFIIGATDETDLEVLKMSEWEYNNFNMRRIYYSAFKAAPNIELKRKSESLTRQNRLYNVDFMMRKYNIPLKEIKEIMADDMLPAQDPKLALAKQNIDSPVNINEASFDELVRVPGIGPKTARKIIEMHDNKIKITKYWQLYQLGVSIKKAVPFIDVDGKTQTRLAEFV